MAKTLIRIRFKRGAVRDAYLVIDEECGWRCFYTTKGSILTNVSGEWEVVEVAGTCDTPEEFIELTGSKPSVFIGTCEVCSGLALIRTSGRGTYCAKCDSALQCLIDYSSDLVH